MTRRTLMSIAAALLLTALWSGSALVWRLIDGLLHPWTFLIVASATTIGLRWLVEREHRSRPNPQVNP